jgi:hypothetical protein
LTKESTLKKERAAELALHARNTNPAKYEELLEIFDSAEGKEAKAEAKFVHSLFNEDAPAAEEPGAAAPGNTTAAKS